MICRLVFYLIMNASVRHHYTHKITKDMSNNWRDMGNFCVVTSVYIYIYIYIVIHRETCFVRSELFSVARQARFPKLGSKPGWLKRQSKILLPSHEETTTSEGNLNAYVSHLFFVYIYPLNGYRELNSFVEPCITLVATIYIYIYIM